MGTPAADPAGGFAGSPAGLRDLSQRVEDLGADEVQLIPTGSDVARAHRVAELLARRSALDQLPSAKSPEGVSGFRAPGTPGRPRLCA